MTYDTFHDLETRSPVPIKHGTHAYAEQAEVTLWAYAGAEGEPRVWDVINGTDNYIEELTGMWAEKSILDQPPRPLANALADPDALVWFQNGGAFDFVVLDKQEPWFTALVPMERRRDTMVQAFAHALPGSLEKMGAIFELVDADRKMVDEGRKYINRFCKPYDTTPEGKPLYYDKRSHPEEWAGFIRYAARDITTMRAAHRLMPTWNYKAGKQMDLWHCDLRIQSRGFAVDVEFATKAIEAAEKAKARMARRTRSLTGGEVAATTQRDKLLAHVLNIYGVDLPDMRADTIERRLEDPDLPAAVKELLGIRLQASMNSPAKYGALLRGVSADGRLRGCAQFRGAGRTGRWAHRMFQPGNLPRPRYPWHYIETGIEAIKLGALDLVVDDEMAMCASALRGCIIAPPGKKLVIADLSNIEGRVAAWIAGEAWKLQAFRDFDTVLGVDAKGKKIRAGLDLYIKSYMGSFNVQALSEDEHEAFLQRQIGKVCELMFQYGGGVGAWITGAATYGIDLVAMSESVYDTLPSDVVDEAQNFLQWMYEQQEGKRQAALVRLHQDVASNVDAEAYAQKLAIIDDAFGPAKARHYLSEKVFITCDSLKRLWRRAHPMISSIWKELEEAVNAAIDCPGATIPVRKLKVRRDGTWLRIGLPSGRALCYPNIRRSKSGSIVYTGQNTYSRQWGPVATYGGKLFENCLGRSTLVATSEGWVSIASVTREMLVWDGVDWVEHHGCVYRGNQATMSAFGVRMTPDHEVLTTEGWRNASSCEGHHRADCRLPDSYPVHGQRRAPVSVGSQVPLWQGSHDGGERSAEAGASGEYLVMRMHAQSDNQRPEHQARDVVSSGVRSVPIDARPMQSTDASILAKLWWTGHHGLRTVARIVCKLLGRHGADLRQRVDSRTQVEQSRVLTEQLHLGDVQTASVQHASKPVPQHPRRPYDAVRGGASVRDRQDNVARTAETRLAPGESVEPVYDLLNCGPRHRFVVLGCDGWPLIVHNCVQAVACDQFAETMPEAEEKGYAIVLGVHDEDVSETPDTEDFTPEELARIMCSDLGWNEGLPLAAAGFETYRYHKE